MLSKSQSKTLRDKEKTFKVSNFVGQSCPKGLYQNYCRYCRLFSGVILKPVQSIIIYTSIYGKEPMESDCKGESKLDTPSVLSH